MSTQNTPEKSELSKTADTIEYSGLVEEAANERAEASQDDKKY